MLAVIIDDERDSREGLKSIIPWQTYGIEQIVEASNGQQGLECVIRHKPQIIFTDIVMPVMDGLQLMEKLSAASIRAKIIIISGHDHFHYAREALRLGAYDYILKPFNTKEVLRVLANCIEEIEVERHTHVQQISDKQLYQEALGEMQKKIINEIIFNHGKEHPRLRARAENSQLHWLFEGPLSVIAIQIDNIQTLTSERHQLQKKDLLLFSIGNIVEDSLKLSGQVAEHALFQSSDDCWILICRHHDAKIMRQISNQLLHHINVYAQLSVTISCSGLTMWDQLPLAYASAIDILAYKSIFGGNRVLSDDVLLSAQYQPVIQSTSLEQSIFTSINTGIVDKHKLTEQIEQIVQNWNHPPKNVLQNQIFQWLFKLERQLQINHPEVAVLTDAPIPAWEHFSQFDTFESIMAQTVAYLEQMARQVQNNHQESLGLIAFEALQIIHSRYAEDITLKSVAEMVYVSPVWLSHLIKEKTGKTFLQLLTHRRMEQAKQLLRDVEYKVYEIPQLVGYSNLDHFYKVFKKHTGMTPKIYRDSN